MSRLERERRERDWTGLKLATLMGLHPSSLSQIERGHRKSWPAFREKAAKALGLSKDELFFDDGTLK
ncbi:MAG: helix-turn-helix domain-containing protein [Candidatus Desulforudis sp.]|nr:helix-turn-helix domain-containing protein [Desulforudis sp.]